MAGYPRPQLVREQWELLDGQWEYEADPMDVGVGRGWSDPSRRPAGRIAVPYPPESPLSGVGVDGPSVHWYRRECEIAPRGDGRVLLHLEAVDFEADVWVNGIHVAHHVGGFTPIRADVTDALVEDGPQVVTVRARDERTDLEQPRGKQDWQKEPHEIWYERTSGLWRDVWWEQVPATRIDTLRWLPDPASGTVGLEVTVVGPAREGLVAECVLAVGADELVTVTGNVQKGTARLTAELPGDVASLRWTPETPVLLDATVRLRGVDAVLDEVGSYLGLRSVGTGDGAFLLNGEPYYLRLVLAQGYWPDSHLAQPDDEAHRHEAELVKALGFNGLRMHQTTADPRFLAWCDRIGLLVWDESPSAFAYSARALTMTLAQLAEMVQRDVNHPSVCAWVPFNESWGVEHVATDPRQQAAVEAGYQLLRALDGTRPVLGNDGWEYTVGDVVGIHDYGHDPTAFADRYANLPEAVRTGRVSDRPIAIRPVDAATPVVLSEFGGFTLSADERAWDAYGAVGSGNELLAELAALVDAVVAVEGLAGFCYTQLTDTRQETNGLLTEDRVPKADPDAIAEIIRRSVRAPAAPR
ncbi:glycoside hydrolase family 2 [Actinotalea sp. M2MS4P-6]|uniref:glycoside hydrolase family 2 protein n=1 Tax=Actinotalea sp. M2MS4P-6 TaxID=2983762 RepID=UPI0021E429E3|nr:glycoside hydrolase family 2 TIM barrel-domain containing protein [Actinotalea sp. M2MS4P-6]MCV2395645.1 glycoside hydrolase family 2 [Actinotalea sp. M2MS4P-6]